ncbi:hypothetical protein, partial [Vibrio vulnificus]|uniref:hypothetical protein n=1 Tax=Vibrio vulnificus TaxID=672 RepID=UPI001CA4A784
MYRETGRGRRREKAAGNVVEKNTLTTKQDENKERLAVIALRKFTFVAQVSAGYSPVNQPASSFRTIAAPAAKALSLAV